MYPRSRLLLVLLRFTVASLLLLVLLQAGVIAALAVSNLPRIKQIPRLWEIPPYSAQFVLTPGIDDFGPLFGDLLE